MRKLFWAALPAAGAGIVIPAFMASLMVGPPHIPSVGLSSSACSAPAGNGPLDSAAVARIAYGAGWRGDDVTIAVAVAKAESNWNPKATNDNSNGSVDYGLFQINSVHGALLASGDWRDPVANAAMAHQVWQDAGGSWTPWVTFWSGAYLKWMDRPGQQACSAATGLHDPGPGPQNVDGLRPRAVNIEAIAQQRWNCQQVSPCPAGYGGYSYRVIAGTGVLSDHATGRAIDIMLGSNYKSDAKRAEGYAISRFFADNAKTLGIKYVIYYDQIDTGTGWRPYAHPSGVDNDVLQHRNHVHISTF